MTNKKHFPTQENINYWRKRFEQQQKKLLEPTDEYLKELEDIFRQSEIDINRNIEYWYQRFIDNNGLPSKAAAKKILNSKELSELKWSIEQYIKHGKENGISKDWNKELENASSKVHIDYFTALELQNRMYIEKLYSSLDINTEDILKDIYKNGYYNNAYEISKGLEVGLTIDKIDENKLNEIIHKPWTKDGKEFSSRIWGYRTELVNVLHNQLSRGILAAKTPEQLSNEIAKTFKSSKYNAKRLVLTESAYFSSLSQRDGYTEIGVKKYQILGTLDIKTCEGCGELDGKIEDFNNYKIGVTAPPFHPNCRCTTIPYINDLDDINEQRIAKDEKGNTIYIPADMKFGDWKKKFVVNKVPASSFIKVEYNKNDSYIEEIEDINYNNNKLIKARLNTFVEKFKNADTEHALVIAPSGKAYTITGSSSNVGIQLAGEDELINSVIIHNHPLQGFNEENKPIFGDCFSKEDLEALLRYKPEEIQVVSGLGRFRMKYKGNEIKINELEDFYDKQRKKAMDLVWSGLSDAKDMTYEQLEIMKVISNSVKGFIFEILELNDKLDDK